MYNLVNFTRYTHLASQLSQNIKRRESALETRCFCHNKSVLQLNITKAVSYHLKSARFCLDLSNLLLK